MTPVRVAAEKSTRSAVDESRLHISGFSFSATEAAIKKPGRLDLGLIYAEEPVQAAGVFTKNRVKAAPVIVSRQLLRRGLAQALLVNSGNANACTGVKGLEDARESARIVAERLQIPQSLVLVASTGVIGQFLPMDRLREAVPQLVQRLAPDRVSELSRAILTTDTVEKVAFRQGVLHGAPVSILGVAKGSGMIMPQMATMLCFVMTDAAITSEALKSSLRLAASLSFNRITVDGDMSTNDSVFAMASGRAGNRCVGLDDVPGMDVFGDLLTGLLVDLAKMMVRDGEGATKLVEIRVTGGRTTAEARKAAYAVANSSLVKTALFGEDANWGRIMGALGRSGAMMDPARVQVTIDGFPLVRDGLGCGSAAEEAATQAMRQREFVISIELGGGPFEFNVWTCDLSTDYVRINAAYRT